MSDRNRYSEILKETSRAFYLSLAVLPSGAREPLSLAYLLARAADTVADSPTEHTDSRTPVLRRMQASLTDVQVGSWDQLRLFQPEKEGEFRLLRAYPEVLELLHESEPSIRQPIRTSLSSSRILPSYMMNQAPSIACPGFSVRPST